MLADLVLNSPSVIYHSFDVSEGRFIMIPAVFIFTLITNSLFYTHSSKLNFCDLKSNYKTKIY